MWVQVPNGLNPKNALKSQETTVREEVKLPATDVY